MAWVFTLMEPPLKDVGHGYSIQPDGRPLAVYSKTVRAARTTLVFVHGTPGSAAAFHAQMVHSFPFRSLLAYDRPGFGGSSGREPASYLSYQSETLVRLVQMISTPQVILVGHSYGCPVALDAALHLPGRVQGVVLMGACLGPQFEQPWRIQSWVRSPLLAWALPREAWQSNEELMHLHADLSEMDGRLGQLACPVLLLHGSVDSQVPVENVEYLHHRLVELHKEAFFHAQIYEGWNHFIPWEQADTVNARIELFLRETALPEPTAQSR
jgi:pimeloyl-ACP methyl ester carboxylesterase